MMAKEGEIKAMLAIGVAVLSLGAAVVAGLGSMRLVDWLNGIYNTAEAYEEWGGVLRARGLLLFAFALGISFYAVWKKQRYLLLAGQVTLALFAFGLLLVCIPCLGLVAVQASLLVVAVPIAMYAVSLLRIAWEAVLGRGEPVELMIGSVLALLAGAALLYGSLLNDKAGALGWAS